MSHSELRLGERVAVNLSQEGGPQQLSVGIVSELKAAGAGEDLAAVFVNAITTVETKLVQLLGSLRKNPWERILPGEWCSIESTYRSFGLF